VFNTVATVGVAAGGAGLASSALGLGGEASGVASLASETSATATAANDVVTITTTNQAMQNLLRAAESGNVRWMAGDANLMRTFDAAVAAGKSTATGRAGFNLLRGRLSRRMNLTGQPIHHWRYDIDTFSAEAMSAENLYITAGEGTHTALHQAIGAAGNPFGAMAPGMAEPGIQSMFNFWLH
jgi:hypothetical protein